ncbi:hypothetical protein [Hamadaea tsunoensis]|uniref:hypothetical protein n=1 Tax=Hamadaea tsunoensis TaxID=53368 RepID=UPI0004179131|nr:hypothetical protein [Hamadaea tsunoensis]
MFTDAETARELQRCTAYDVPEVAPVTHEEHFYTATREMAQAACQELGGKTWEAHAVMPRYWRDENHQTDQVIILDDALLIVFSHIVKHGQRDRLRLTLNGTPVAHRPLRGVMAWHHDAAVRSLYLHVRLIEPDPCDAFTCRKAPEWTGLNGVAYCDEHAALYL